MAEQACQGVQIRQMNIKDQHDKKQHHNAKKCENTDESYAIADTLGRHAARGARGASTEGAAPGAKDLGVGQSAPRMTRSTPLLQA
eukprot:7159998-Pyramimonas_sp.AAC.1